MDHRRNLLAILALAAGCHAWFIARTLLPAQDGLKYIRVARTFQKGPWGDALRGADVHPLYPALIAVVEPIVEPFLGPGPDAWRAAAQMVAALASLGLVAAIYFLTEPIFDRRIAFVAAGLLTLLPRLAELGRDTLADSLSLSLTFLALVLGARALRGGPGQWPWALACGLAIGAGYLARPEAILVLGALSLTAIAAGGLGQAGGLGRGFAGRARASVRSLVRAGPALSLVFLTTAVPIAGYAALKGEVSEKLSLRIGADLGPQAILKRSAPQWVPEALQGPRWDFSPKEESERSPIPNWRVATLRIVDTWWEALCWGFAVMTVWGMARARFIRGLSHRSEDRREADGAAERPIEGPLLLAFAVVHVLALLRHASMLGYLSGRHVMPLVVASMPWAAAGTYICCRGLARVFRLPERWYACARIAVTAALIAASLMVQAGPGHRGHRSRWGHWAAGRWLAEHAERGEALLDTRGWARFVSGLPGYDYWHVRQALTDARLSYVLVGLDELRAGTPRAETLNAVLAFAARPLRDFPDCPGGRSASVRLYRFRRPDNWEGLAR